MPNRTDPNNMESNIKFHVNPKKKKKKLISRTQPNQSKQRKQ